MIQKHNSNDMNLKLFFVLLSLIFCGCSEETYCPQNFYKVKKIVKKKNNVFFIYAEKNDSIYKIYTHYNTPIRDKIAISCMLREIHEFSSHAIRHGLYIKNRKRLFCP